MVSDTIIPIIARVEITVASLGCKEFLKTLLDSGCTRCLISPGMEGKLGMRLRELKTPISFPQFGGTIVRGDQPHS